MKLETLQQAKELEKNIQKKKDTLFAYERFFDKEKGNEVTVRIKGTDFTLPKGIFNAELQKKISQTKKDIKDLEKGLEDL